MKCRKTIATIDLKLANFMGLLKGPYEVDVRLPNVSVYPNFFRLPQGETLCEFEARRPGSTVLLAINH